MLVFFLNCQMNRFMRLPYIFEDFDEQVSKLIVQQSSSFVYRLKNKFKKLTQQEMPQPYEAAEVLVWIVPHAEVSDAFPGAEIGTFGAWTSFHHQT